MKKYIQKIEKLVKQKMSEAEPKKEKEQKGFMAKKENTKIKSKDNNMDLIDIVADAIVHVRKKRMELK